MKTFEIEFDLRGHRYFSTVEAWDNWDIEQAKEVFLRDNPGAEIIGVTGE